MSISLFILFQLLVDFLSHHLQPVEVVRFHTANLRHVAGELLFFMFSLIIIQLSVTVTIGVLLEDSFYIKFSTLFLFLFPLYVFLSLCEEPHALSLSNLLSALGSTQLSPVIHVGLSDMLLGPIIGHFLLI